MRKVACVITSRASYARIKSALLSIEAHPALDLRIIVAASALLEKYGSITSVLERDGLRISERVYMVLEGENPVTMAKTTGIGIMELTTIFDNLRPDVVLTVADRYETLATAVSAAYMNLPLAHVQGGEVTGSIDEKVRHAVTKLADLHFVATPLAAQRVIRMGENRDKVFVTGCPSIDLAASVLSETDGLPDPIERFGGVGARLDFDKPFIVVMQHPVTTEYERAREQVEQTLAAIQKLRMPTTWFWPNVDAGSDAVSKALRTFRELSSPDHIHFFKNMPPEDFLRLLRRSACIVGNSSVAIRECSYLGVPAVNIGTRQRDRERGRNVIDVGYDGEEIRHAIERQIEHGPYSVEKVYGDGVAGARIADLLFRVPLSFEKHFIWGR